MNVDSMQGIDPAIVCAIITVTGTIISGFIAWGVSRSTAKRELKKLRLIWKHESALSLDDDFARMADSVARYIHCGRRADGVDAVGKVNALRTRESGALAEALDSLYCAIDNSKDQEYPNYEKIQQCLSAVIEENRIKQRQEQR